MHLSSNAPQCASTVQRSRATIMHHNIQRLMLCALRCTTSSKIVRELCREHSRMTAACSGASQADAVCLDGRNAAWPVRAQVWKFPGRVVGPYSFSTQLELFPATSTVPNRWLSCPYTTHLLNACQTQEPGLCLTQETLPDPRWQPTSHGMSAPNRVAATVT